MCSRYETAEEAELARLYKPKVTFMNWDFKSLIFPGYDTLLMRLEEGQLILEKRFWGLVYRIPGKREPKKLLEKIAQNAVSETVAEKRTFKKAWADGHRCILPAVKFMEPKDGKFVSIIDSKSPILLLAGIWGPTCYKEQPRDACTMLTCEPNSFTEEFHDRMPVILSSDDADEWLSPDTAPEQAKKLCKPYSGKLKFA